MDMNLLIQKGATDVTLQVKLRDAANGSLKTGVTIANLDVYYTRVADDASVTLVGPIDVTALSLPSDVHSDDKAIEIGLGLYRFDFRDAIFATGAKTGTIVIVDGAGGTILPATIDFQLVDFNPYDLKGDINDQVDAALNTAIPGAPTADSINERLKAIDDKLPSKAYLTGTANSDGDVQIDEATGSLSAAVKADINTEVDAALNTAIPAVPTPDSINERLAAIDDKLPSKAYLAGTDNVDGDIELDEATGTPTVNIGTILADADAATALVRAAKLLGHKTSEDKSTGTITIYDSDGVTPLYTKTASQTESTRDYGAIS